MKKYSKNLKNLYKIILRFILLFLFFNTAFADEVNLVNPIKSESFEGVIENITNWLIKLGAPLAAVMVIIGGIQMLFSGGSPEKFKKGQQTILYTAIGYGIIIAASGIIKLVEALLNTTSS